MASKTILKLTKMFAVLDDGRTETDVKNELDAFILSGLEKTIDHEECYFELMEICFPVIGDDDEPPIRQEEPDDSPFWNVFNELVEVVLVEIQRQRQRQQQQQ
jgi:hypothetical protein